MKRIWCSLICLTISSSALLAEEKPAAPAPVLPLPTESVSQEPATQPVPGPAPAPDSVPAAETSEKAAVAMKKGPESYEKLTIKDGTVYQKCRVIRAEPDTLLVEHTGGMAKLSFFDLSEEVQNEWGFDPFKAIEHFKARNEAERALRWRLFREKQAYESDQAHIADTLRLQEKAAREWVPVEAKVIKRLKDGGVIASCQRVTFRKTKTKSTLGFVIDGPPKRVLVPFSKGLVSLRFDVPLAAPLATGRVWKGYVHPVSEGEVTHLIRGQSIKTTVHAASPPKN